MIIDQLEDTTNPYDSLVEDFDSAPSENSEPTTTELPMTSEVEVAPDKTEANTHEHFLKEIGRIQNEIAYTKKVLHQHVNADAHDNLEDTAGTLKGLYDSLLKAKNDYEKSLLKIKNDGKAKK